MKFLVFVLLSVMATPLLAQDSPLETARSFMKSGDFDNAALVLNKALQANPGDMALQKDLVLAYYYKRDYTRALEALKPVLSRDDADIMAYQIGGNVYKALEEVKEADKMYKKALKKFPASGALYSEYGELLTAQKDNSAIALWEKGIQADPSYAGNYYNAAIYYYHLKDKIWTLIYGETFVNMEYLTERATEMKNLLLSTYKEKLFNVSIAEKDALSPKNDFEKAVYQTYQKQSSLTDRGINLQSLNMIRTRFLLDWYATYAAKYPVRLFDYQQQLIREGLWESYNQWLFGLTENLPAFEQWTKTNAEAYTRFDNFQKNRVFKVPKGQYYGN